MKSCRRISNLLIVLALAAVFGYQINSFAQNYPVNGNPGYPQANPPAASPVPYQQPVGGYVAPTNTQPAVPMSVPMTAPMAAPTTMPTGGAPMIAQGGTAPPNNYMIDRPLGTMPNGAVPPGNQTAMQPQNVRPILPPPWEKEHAPTQEELKYIDQFLTHWGQQSQSIEALDYAFTCRQGSNSFGNSETYGRVKFRAPNKGMIEIDSELINGKKSNETLKKMKVVCTGEAVYQFDYTGKKLTEFVIPKEQQGKGVMDSPLMILVGVNPQELQERFYLKAVNPWWDVVANCYCFQAWPKWTEDVKEFKTVKLAIDKNTFHAKELIVFDPSGDGGKAYEITSTQKNIRERITPGILAKDEFARNDILKSMPRDWTFETKNDFIPEATSGQQYVQQPNPATAQPYPQYGNPANVPNNPPVQPNMMPPQNPSPNQTQLSYNGTPVVNYAQPNTPIAQNPYQQGQTPTTSTGNVAPQYTFPSPGFVR